MNRSHIEIDSKNFPLRQGKQNARLCDVGNWIVLHDHDKAIFEVVGKTQVEPRDNVEIKLVRGHSDLRTGDLHGGEAVAVVELI